MPVHPSDCPSIRPLISPSLRPSFAPSMYCSSSLVGPQHSLEAMCTTEPPKEGTPLKGQSVSRLVRLADDARLVVAVAVVLYVISGICQPLGVDYLKYQGFMGSKDPSVPSTHIGVLLNTLGMAGVGAVFLLRHPWPQLSQVQYRNMLIVCAIDLVSQALVMYGQLKVTCAPALCCVL